MIIYRIDDRLVHGQVIVGWIKNLGLKWLYLIDNEITENQQMIMRLTVPQEIEFKILNIANVKDEITRDLSDKPGMILVKSPSEILSLLAAGVKIKKVHIGGLHFKPGRSQYCEFIFLSPKEVEAIREIISHDTVVMVQSLPSRREIPVEKLIQK
ncbi:PTS sugar transporter subunit IIB [Candidatus Dependentiae bacterium]|nr:PTS sugar transporter subunit IIB [Candidatus Dependentiae bacterium]